MNTMKPTTQLTEQFGGAAGMAAIILLAAAATARCENDWQDKAIAPVVNPIYFEDPRIYSEVRPIFMQHWLPDTFAYSGGNLPLGGVVRVYAVQLRLKLSDRLALIATKDGYIEFRPDNTLPHAYGWADLAAGLKYALVDDRENQLIVTPGFTVTVPTGNQRVFQHHGKGEENIFVSAAKGWDNFHVTGNLGCRIPNDFDLATAQLHYSLQLDYHVIRYFIPFVAVNGYTILSNGKDAASQSLTAVPLNAEGYDLINFGAADAKGTTQLTVGGGARSKLTKNVDLGVAYEAAVRNPKGIFDSRITADISLHW
jgi:hypothetical protein